MNADILSRVVYAQFIGSSELRNMQYTCNSTNASLHKLQFRAAAALL